MAESAGTNCTNQGGPDRTCIAAVSFSRLSSLFLVTACASVEQPKPDPVKEELTLLQKQLLELQKLQNETRAKLEESTATITLLSSKIQSLEERQPVPRTAVQTQIESKPAPSPDKKKPVTKKKKTKKKTRRQE